MFKNSYALEYCKQISWLAQHRFLTFPKKPENCPTEPQNTITFILNLFTAEMGKKHTDVLESAFLLARNRIIATQYVK
jgi:hypothetical protein